MPLSEVLKKVIAEYPSASKEKFKGHQFASYLRRDVPESLIASLELPEVYSIKASAGNGAWAKIPWIAVFNRLITETVTSGFYCVYLFCADCSGAYLSLNQGIAGKRNKYGLSVSRDMVRSQALLFREIIGEKKPTGFTDSLDLKLECIPKETTTRRLGLAYEAGNIMSKCYPKDNIPNNRLLIEDLDELLSTYFILFKKRELERNLDKTSLDKELWIEDTTRYRLHRVTERNQSLSKRVKELQGYTCKACGFNFEDRYGEIGKQFIEAHHVVPISDVKMTRMQLNPMRDFIVLCSNCHRMIHKIRPTPTLEAFRKNLIL